MKVQPMTQSIEPLEQSTIDRLYGTIRQNYSGQVTMNGLHSAHRVVPDEDSSQLFRIKSFRSDNVYEVQLVGMDEGIHYRLCTCENGRNHGGPAVCFHAAAAEAFARLTGRVRG